MGLNKADHAPDRGRRHHEFVALHAGWSGSRGLSGFDFRFVHSGVTAAALVPPLRGVLHRPQIGMLTAGRAKRLGFRVAFCAEAERPVGPIRH